jgi:hypothetical protein
MTLVARGLLIALVVAAWLSAFSSTTLASPPTHQVVFVCEHGNVKSLMAASYFNTMAQARGLPFRAVSRGSAPDSDTVPDFVRAPQRVRTMPARAIRSRRTLRIYWKDWRVLNEHSERVGSEHPTLAALIT